MAKDISDLEVYEVGDVEEFRAEGKIFKRHREADPIFQADWVKALMEAKGWETQGEAADHIEDLSQPEISRLLALKEDLLQELQERARLPKSKDRSIAKRTAYLLSKLPPEEQRKFLEKEKITIEMVQDAKRKHRRKSWVSDDLKQEMKQPGPTGLPTPKREEQPEQGEQPKRGRENTNEVAPILEGKRPPSERWDFINDDYRYKKIKCVCPRCGHEFYVAIEEEGSNRDR